MSSLSTNPYKGTRDYYPEEMRARNYIFDTWRAVVHEYGYEEYGVPLLEPVEVYSAKSGQELVGEQTYRFTDRGDREVVIRPELTPSVSRIVAARRQEMAYPARLFNIANFMRYERPQRGREREFWQLNVDVFGAEGYRADAEIISVGHDIMKRFNASDDMYVIKINDRRVIEAMMHEYLLLDSIQAHMMIKLFDKKNKITVEQFRDQAIDIFGQSTAPQGLKKISQLLTAKSIDELPAEIATSDAILHLKKVITTLKAQGIKNIVFDSTLMRGFDYYTGVVFEFFDNAPENNRAMFGGGRYDGLVGLFGAEPLSAIGMAPGLSATELFIESHGLLPVFYSSTELYMVVLGEEYIDGAATLAHTLRKEGVRVELDFTGRKLDKQVKTAVKKRIPNMIFVGKRELETELFKLKDVQTGDEETLSFERMVGKVKDRRRKHASGSEDLFD